MEVQQPVSLLASSTLLFDLLAGLPALRSLHCELLFPLNPGSLRGGNPRKMGKNYKIPLPSPTPEIGPKNYDNSIFFFRFGGIFPIGEKALKNYNNLATEGSWPVQGKEPLENQPSELPALVGLQKMV